MSFESNKSAIFLEQLSLFTQDSYCKEYIDKQNLYTSAKDIERAAKISAACFRQAKEYLTASQHITLATKPLLIAYAQNNFIKGTAYLKRNDLSSHFERHGLQLKEENIADNFIDSKIIKQFGVTTAIEHLLGLGHISNSSPMSIGEMLSLIPTVSRYYCDIYSKAPRVFEAHRGSRHGYITYSVKINDGLDPDELAKEYEALTLVGLPLEYSPYGKRFIIRGVEGLIAKTPEQVQRLIATDDFFITPIIVNAQLYWMPPLYTSYLLMLTYSMLVRYHAEKWFGFIDPQKSTSYTIIDISTKYALEIFVDGIHALLFDVDPLDHYNRQSSNEFVHMLMKHKHLIAGMVKEEMRFF